MVHEQMVNGFSAAKLLQILRISKPLNMFYSIFSKQKNTTHCHSACCIFRFSFRNLSNMFPYIRPMSIFIFSSQIALFRHINKKSLPKMTGMRERGERERGYSSTDLKLKPIVPSVVYFSTFPSSRHSSLFLHFLRL